MIHIARLMDFISYLLQTINKHTHIRVFLLPSYSLLYISHYFLRSAPTTPKKWSHNVHTHWKGEKQRQFLPTRVPKHCWDSWRSVFWLLALCPFIRTKIQGGNEWSSLGRTNPSSSPPPTDQTHFLVYCFLVRSEFLLLLFFYVTKWKTQPTNTI